MSGLLRCTSAQEMSDDEKWKTKAKDCQKTFYLSFSGTQWHQFDRKKDADLLKVIICYAMFGPPASVAEAVEEAYSADQKKNAEKIMNAVFELHVKSAVRDLRIGFIFICCKQGINDFVLPLFSVCVGTDVSGNDRRCFADLQCRTYKSWDDWKKNNVLPAVIYAYPTRGFYTCSGNSTYEFDTERPPDIEFGHSPASSIKSKILQGTDILTTAISLGSGFTGMIALFTPLAPVAIAAAAIGGATSTTYGLARGITRLVDKGQHGESLADFESLTIWLSIAATPLHFTSSLFNAKLMAGAQQGRIFSSSTRMFATILNFTTLGVDSMMFMAGLSNLIRKAMDKELTTLDVLQFSMSAFFFTNTLMQPKVASTIIKLAQTMHLERYSNAMSDETAKESFNNFLDRNRGDGGNKDTSKIIRTVNRMEDPNKFFKSIPTGSNVDIGGRKGHTVLVSDTNGHANQINPNRVMLNKDTSTPTHPFNFNKDYNRLKKCYSKDPDDVELNGKKIFRNMSQRDKRRIGKVFNGSAKCDAHIIQTSHNIAESMGLTTADDLMNVIEIVVAEVKGKSGAELTNSLNILAGPGMNVFIKSIQSDTTNALRTAMDNGLSFESPLVAVYHFRKHGPKYIARFGDHIDVYLGPISSRIFNDSNLKEVFTLQEGTVRKLYATNEDYFGVITSTPSGQKISTMFRYHGRSQEFTQNLIDYFKDSPDQLGTVNNAAQLVARFLGLRSFQVYITVDGKKTLATDGTVMDPDIQKEIAHYLNAVTI